MSLPSSQPWVIRKLVAGICKRLWVFIAVAEWTYWYLKRNVQKETFLSCGDRVHIGRHCFFTKKTIIIGDDVSVGEGCRFQSTLSRIIIGSHVMFGPNVSIHGGNHRMDVVGKYMKEIGLDDKRDEDDMDIAIGDDVWVGAGATILDGVTIGEGAVIGAGTVVSRTVLPYTVLVGCKNRELRTRFDSQTIARHKLQLTLKERVASRAKYELCSRHKSLQAICGHTNRGDEA